MKSTKSPLQWLHRKKSTARNAASSLETSAKSGNTAESILDTFSLALNLAEQALDIAEVAPFIGPAAAILHKIIDSYKEFKTTGETHDALAIHIADLTGDICATVLRMQETDHSDQIGRLKQDLEKYAFLISKASHFLNNYDNHGRLAHIAGRNQLQGEMDKLNHELDSYGARFGNNRLMDLYIKQGVDAQIQHKVHDIVVEERLEKWLQAPPNMTTKQHETEKLQMEGTGQWLLEGDTFINWEDNAGVLWIEGSTGTGKSVLSATVIKNLFAEGKRFTPCPPAIAFFYFDFRNKEAQSVEIALRRILLQLSAQAPHPYETLNKHYELSDGQKLPSSQDLLSILYRLLHELGRTYIILDALDECNDFKQIVALVLVLSEWKKTPLHLLITSQHRDIFTKGFGSVAQVVLDVNVTQRDIEFFVSNELQTNSDLEAWQSNATQIAEQVTLKSNGMFRLAACLLTELAHYVYPEDEDLHQVLESLPNDLFGIYDRFILAIPTHWFPYAEAALQWIMFNCGNWDTELSLPVLADAVSFDFSSSIQFIYKPNRQGPNKSAISKWLAGLITVGGKVVTLAHASVQDYLLSGHFKQTFHCDLADNLSHDLISRTCISYLDNFRNHPLESEKVHLYPLAEYAAQHWYYHTISSKDKKSLLSRGIQLLDDRSYHVLLHLADRWKSVNPPRLHFCCEMGYFECVSHFLANRAVIDLVVENSTPLIHATSWGHQETVQLLLEKGANVDLGGQGYDSALGTACYQSHQEIARLLLENGADVDLGGGEYGSPLGTACYQGNQEIAQLLLEKGADVNLAGGNYGSPLGAACYWGQQETVQLLLENGADVNLAGGEYGSALGTACYQGHQEIARLLLEKGADVNLAGGEYGNALGTACYQGHQEIAQLLLEKNADVNLEGGNYGSPLGAACYRGHQEIAQLLLEKNTDVNLGGGNYGSPLGAACYWGHQEIAQLLLENSADVNLGGGHHGSPLGAACDQGHLEIVQLLLNKGAGVNLIGGDHGSALGTASYSGKQEIAQLLLEKGADPNLRGGTNGSPLVAACYWGYQEIAHLLLEKGADVTLGDENYGSPLGAACYWGQQGIAWLLLEKGADVNFGGGHHGSPLGAACDQGHLEIVQLLLNKGAGVNLRGGNNGSSLGAACNQGQLEIVKLLLKQGADINIRGGDHGCPLGTACYRGELEIAQLLLERGADVNLRGGEYGSPLGAACHWGKLEIGELLLEEGADVNLGGGNHGSPLGAACYRGQLDIVQLLLHKGADVNLRGGNHGSPLGAACDQGKLEIIQFLLEKGADINLSGGEHGSPLGTTCYWGELEIAQLLLEKGADVNLRGGNHDSPLHTACYQGELEIAQLLLEKGADSSLLFL
ncbi:ankyrin repeat-containing domain protein [Mycena galopus ATCC 62051]|nr:ankyrin repeat-containing domain protein [Mycena galopus ATCC 62051]